MSAVTGGAFEVVLPGTLPAREVAPGFRITDLWMRDGRKAQFVEIGPGARYPTIDLHEPGPEELFVVSGSFNDGASEYPAGTFVHCPRGSWHQVSSALGATLFLFYPDG